MCAMYPRMARSYKRAANSWCRSERWMLAKPKPRRMVLATAHTIIELARWTSPGTAAAVCAFLMERTAPRLMVRFLVLQVLQNWSFTILPIILAMFERTILSLILMPALGMASQTLLIR